MKTIPLRGKKGLGKCTLVSDADYEKISKHKWYLETNGYARRRTNKNYKEYLHQCVLGKRKNFITDHIDGNKLNNQKSNLRFATKSENALNVTGLISSNTSGFTGVYWNEERNHWQSFVKYRNKTRYLGQFKDIFEAALVRDAVMFELYRGIINGK